MSQDSITRVSICVLNWENFPDTKNCTDSILALPELQAPDIHTDLIIIDNGSLDQSVEKLRCHIEELACKQIHLLTNAENLGYAGGNNRGIDYALGNLNPAYIWVLNNDTLPLPGSLKALVNAALNKPEVAILGSTLLDAGAETVQCAGGCYYNSWLGIYTPALAGVGRDELPGLNLDKKLDYVSGAAIFVRSDVFARIGGLSDRYFLYYEELDLVNHLQPGDEIDWCRESQVIHIGGNTVNQATSQRSIFAEYHSMLSLLLYTRKYYPVRLLTVIPILILGKTGIYLLNRNISMFRALYSAIRDFAYKDSRLS